MTQWMGEDLEMHMRFVPSHLPPPGNLSGLCGSGVKVWKEGGNVRNQHTYSIHFLLRHSSFWGITIWTQVGFEEWSGWGDVYELQPRIPPRYHWDLHTRSMKVWSGETQSMFASECFQCLCGQRPDRGDPPPSTWALKHTYSLQFRPSAVAVKEYSSLQTLVMTRIQIRTNKQCRWSWRLHFFSNSSSSCHTRNPFRKYTDWKGGSGFSPSS